MNSDNTRVVKFDFFSLVQPVRFQFGSDINAISWMLCMQVPPGFMPEFGRASSKMHCLPNCQLEITQIVEIFYPAVAPGLCLLNHRIAEAILSGSNSHNIHI